MTSQSGNLFTVKKGGVKIGGIQQGDIARDRTLIDITSNDDSGNQTFHEKSGTRGINASISGVLKDTIVETEIKSDNVIMTDLTIEQADGTVLSGNFAFDGFSITASFDGAVTFSCTIKSSSAITET